MYVKFISMSLKQTNPWSSIFFKKLITSYLAAYYPIWEFQSGADKDSTMFSVLSHMSPVNSNSLWIFTIFFSRSLNSTLSSFQALQPQLHLSLNLSVSSLGAPIETCVSRLISLFPSGAPIKTLRLSTHHFLSFRCSNWNFVSRLISLFPSGAPIETLRLSTHHFLPFRCSNWNFASPDSSLSSLQALQSKLYVSQLISFLPPGATEIICLSTLLSISSFHVTLIFTLTSVYTWHMCSRCYVSFFHLNTIISSICLNVATRLVSLSWRNVCSQEVAAWFNVGIFYKSLVSHVLLKGSKDV